MIGDSRMGRSTNRHGKAVRGKLQPIAFTVEYAFYPNSGKLFWRVVRDDGEIMSYGFNEQKIPGVDYSRDDECVEQSDDKLDPEDSYEDKDFYDDKGHLLFSRSVARLKRD